MLLLLHGNVALLQKLNLPIKYPQIFPTKTWSLFSFRLRANPMQLEAFWENTLIESVSLGFYPNNVNVEYSCVVICTGFLYIKPDF